MTGNAGLRWRGVSSAAAIPRHPGAPVGDAPERDLQAWRAWAGCGDGGQVHLIIDPPAHEVWLLPGGDMKTGPRSL
jgi:hypothetical protein